MATRYNRPRTNRNFGKGDIRGVIGPGKLEQRKGGWRLVPTLIFGIPGSGSMAVFLGGDRAVWGMIGAAHGAQQPRHHLHDVWSLALANVIGAGLCIFPRQSHREAAPDDPLHADRAIPVFMVIAFAAFQSRQSLGDLAALMAVG